MRASLVALALMWAGCSFPSNGVPLTGDDAPDAEIETPPDACVVGTETCDGLDNDCDGLTDEGLTSGAACDGDDADLCEDDTIICDSAGAEVCSSGDDNAELCNAADDDCDLAMDEGFALDVDCDGADGDACNEGKTICSGDGLSTTCNDATDTIAETCNNADDDCDGTPDDGFDKTTDELNCNTCGNTCTNANGTTMCLSSTCTPVCTNGFASCNGDPDDGCETLQDTNPLCASSSVTPDATVNGDVGSQTAEIKGTTERFLRIRLVESSQGGGSSQAPTTGTFTLVSGAGANFRLEVYCPSCGSTPLTNAGNVVGVGHSEAAGDRSFDVFVAIVYDGTTPSTTCAQWTLTVAGNSGTANRCAG